MRRGANSCLIIGLLVAVAPQAVGDVLDIFRRDGFAGAADIGEITAGPARVRVS